MLENALLNQVSSDVNYNYSYALKVSEYLTCLMYLARYHPST